MIDLISLVLSLYIYTIAIVSETFSCGNLKKILIKIYIQLIGLSANQTKAGADAK